MKSLLHCLALAGAAGVVLPVSAQMYRVTVENLAPSTPIGLYHSPVWVGFHDGTFDLFDSGTTASAGMEALAELGDSSLINAAFMAAQPGGKSVVLNDPAGPGPGIFAPGRSRSAEFTLDAAKHRYLSFGSMIVPSNDSFIANADPTGLPLFDSTGGFLGARSWTLTGAQVWDAGTEVNDPLDGAAFVAGVDAMLGTVEGGRIHGQPLHGLDDGIGLQTPAGTVIGEALMTDPLVRVTITPVPEPGAYGAAAAAGLLALMLRRRRRASD